MLCTMQQCKSKEILFTIYLYIVDQFVTFPKPVDSLIVRGYRKLKFIHIM